MLRLMNDRRNMHANFLFDLSTTSITLSSSHKCTMSQQPNSGPTLYHVPRTISSPIYQVLIELDVVNNPVKVETLTFADLKTSEHLARNPMGSSPAFTDEGNHIAIWESGAVLTYLLELYDTSYQLHPQIPPLVVVGKQVSSTSKKKERADFLHLQQYIIATVYPFVASLFIHTLKPAEEQDKTYVESAKGKWKTLLAPTLSKFLGDSKFFVGDKLTAVDLLVAKPLGNAHSMGLLTEEEFPTLYTLFKNIESMPSFTKAYSQPPTTTTTADQNKNETVEQPKEGRSFVLRPGDDDNDGAK